MTRFLVTGHFLDKAQERETAGRIRSISVVLDQRKEKVVVIASSTSGGADTGLVVFLLVLAVAAWIGYNVFKNRGMRPRQIVTNLSPQQLRENFRDTVAGNTWSIVDDGNPIVAQSSLLAGIRQQIALRIEERDGRTYANLAVIRYSKKVLGGATKAHTLRWRMTTFLSQVRAADSTASVAG